MWCAVCRSVYVSLRYQRFRAPLTPHTFSSRLTRTPSGGADACTIHYGRNDKALARGSLVLMDAGCEYWGYVSDVTRTWPVGRQGFSGPQRDVYAVVLEAHQRWGRAGVCIEGAVASQVGAALALQCGHQQAGWLELLVWCAECACAAAASEAGLGTPCPGHRAVQSVSTQLGDQVHVGWYGRHSGALMQLLYRGTSLQLPNGVRGPCATLQKAYS